MHAIKLPTGQTVIHPGTREEAEAERAFLYARHAFVLKYMAEKGWGDEVGELSLQQAMEIREQPGWKEPKEEPPSLVISLMALSIALKAARFNAAEKYMKEKGWGDELGNLTLRQALHVGRQPCVKFPPPFTKKATRLVLLGMFTDAGFRVYGRAKAALQDFLDKGCPPQ